MCISRSAMIGLGLCAALTVPVGIEAAARSPSHEPTKAEADRLLVAPGWIARDHQQQTPFKLAHGEDADAHGRGLDSRTRFFLDLELVRGHLFVGDELVRLGLWEEALPHFQHPLEQVYAGIAKRLKIHGVRQFDAALDALAGIVRAKSSDDYPAAFRLVDERITEVDKSLGKYAEPAVEWRVKTLIAVIRATEREYRNALDGERIVNIVEYQDSRGFAFQAANLLANMAPALTKRNAATFQEMNELMGKLKRAWPAPKAPERLVVPEAEVSAYASQLERAAIVYLRK